MARPAADAAAPRGEAAAPRPAARLLRVLPALAVLAALVLAALVNDRLPRAEDVASAPFLRPGRVGDVVRLETADIKLTGVAAGPLLKGDEVVRTPHLWLVLLVEFTPRGRPGQLNPPTLVAPDGRVFGDAQPLATRCGPEQPGFTVTCQLVMEVAADALAGARVRFDAQHDLHWSGRAAIEVADFDLGLTAEQVAAFAARTAPIEVGTATVRAVP